MMPAPSAPYFPPSYYAQRNLTSPLQPPLDCNGMNKGAMNNMMEMSYLNRVNQVGVESINRVTDGINRGCNITSTSFIVGGGQGSNYFSPSPHPIPMNCPHCKSDIVTLCKPTTGCFTHLVAGGLCCLGFYLCFCCPYFMNTFKDIEHHCPQCKMYLGVFKRL